MSSVSNSLFAFIALMAILTFALLLALLVMMIVNLTKLNGIWRRTGGAASQVGSAKASAKSQVLQGLKADNASLQSQLQLEREARQSAETRARTAELAAESATSDIRKQIRQGVEEGRAKDIVQLHEKLRGVELHNMSLHQECADLRAQLAKTGKRAVANHADLSETEQLLEKATGRLATATSERDAAQREIASLKIEIEKLKAEISALLARLAGAERNAVPKNSVTTKGAPPSLKANSAKPNPLPAPKLAPKKSPKSKPPIVTRTSAAATSGVSEFDDQDKPWNAVEDVELLGAYVATRSLAATAQAIGVDQKQVALRLIFLLLSPHGLIDDPSAPNYGATYSAADSKAIVKAWRDGRKLPSIARDFQRDQLGIGWKLLDDASHPVDVTTHMIPDIVDGVHR